jgi:hypothetical protein
LAEDANGNVDPNFNGTVNLALFDDKLNLLPLTDTPGHPLLNTTAANGVATFSAVRLTQGGSGFTLQATSGESGELTSEPSQPFDVIGYTPAQIRTAYGINAIPKDAAGKTLDGTGQTIAIVGAYDDPTVFQDVDAFDTQFGLTASGPTLYQQYGAASSFLTVLNQAGQPSPLPTVDPDGPSRNSAEAEEIMDIEWAHAIAPGAHIDVIECSSEDDADLFAGAKKAASLPGVSVVSISFGNNEGTGTDDVTAADEAKYDPYFVAPGVTFLAATGDKGTADASYPAFSPNVVAVGGTSLTLHTDGSYKEETGWSGSGGGPSKYEPEPSYQQSVQTTGSRTIPDVAFVADDKTPAAVYDSYDGSAAKPWDEGNGTSLATPCWAGLIALVNQGRVDAGGKVLNASSPTETQNALYHLPGSDFHHNLGGSNGTTPNGIIKGAPYDEITGLGSPVANLLVPALAAVPSQVTTTSLDWDKGGVKFDYEVSNSPLPKDVPIRFYWAPSDTFTIDQDTLAYTYTVPAGTQVQTQPIGPIHIDGTDLSEAPEGTEYLLAVADPENTLGNSVTDVESLKVQLPVAKLYQNQGPWATHPTYMGSSADTINDYGCALTSLAMGLTYAGVTTDPAQLNVLLSNSPNPGPQSGYVGEDILNWGPATAIAANAAGKPSVYFDFTDNGSTDPQDLRDLLTTNAAPVIVRVDNPTTGHQHFVLVTGIDGDTFAINDPGYQSRTTLQPYGNSFQIVGVVKDPPSDISALYVASSSPGTGVALTVTDPQGHVTGQATGAASSLKGIPHSVYFTEGPLENLNGQSSNNTTGQFVYISQPVAGAYSIQTSGATGPADLEIAYVAPDGTIQSQQTVHVPGSGSPQTFQLALNSSHTLNALVQLTNGPTNLAGQFPPGTAGRAYGETINASGGSGDKTLRYTVTSGALPAGLAFHASTNALDVTGTPGAAGTVTFDVTARDAAGDTATQTYTLTINPAVSLTPGAIPGGTVGKAFSQVIVAQSGTGDKSLAYTVTSGAIPAGLSFTAKPNELDIAGKPTAAGSVTFQVKATDAVGATATQTYTLAVATASPGGGGGRSAGSTGGSANGGGGGPAPQGLTMDQKLRAAMDALFVAVGWESDNVFLVEFGLWDLQPLLSSMSDPILSSAPVSAVQARLHDILLRMGFGQGQAATT